MIGCGNFYVPQRDLLQQDLEEAGSQPLTAEVTLSASVVAATEGGAGGSYELSLSVPPAAEVTISLTVDSEVAVDASSVLFTPDTWDAAQVITVTAVDDAASEGNHTAVIGHTVSSLDPNYDGLAVDDVVVEIVDNDSAGVSISPINLGVTEGGAGASYTVVLTNPPVADVTVGIVPGPEVSTVPAAHTFTTATWDTPQVVSVGAVDDAVFEAAHNETITHTVTSSDPDYDALATADVSVAITDNEQALSIYVTSGANLLRVDDMAGSGLTSYDGGGAFSVGLEEIWADAANIYVTDANGDLLYRFDDMSGAGLEQYNGSTGTLFNDPRAVFVSGGSIYVATGMGRLIYRFDDMAGAGQVEYDGTAAGGTQFWRPNRIFIHGSGIYLADYDNVTPDPRLYRFDDMAGTNQEEYGTGGAFFTNLRDVVVDSLGRVYALDLTEQLLYRFDDMTGAGQVSYDGSAGTPFQTPRAVAIDTLDRIYILDGGTQLLYRIDDITGAGQVELSIGGATGSDVFVVGP